MSDIVCNEARVSNNALATEQRIRLLQGIPVFGGITDDTLKFVLDNAEEIRLAEGEYLFREGDLVDGAYVLERGSIKLYQRYKNADYLVGSLQEGDCLGNRALIGIFPRMVSAQAAEESVAIKLSCSILRSIHERNHEQYVLILMNMARELARRLRDADMHLLATQVEHHLVHPE